MKRTISFLLSLVMVLGIFVSVPVTVSAASSGKCGDNLTWTLNDKGTLTINGTGDMYNYGPDSGSFNKRPWYIDCYDIKTVIIDEGVTSISDYAFYDCTNLTSITIPNSVKSIGYYALHNIGYYNIESNWKDKVLYIGNHLVAAKTDISGVCTIKPGTKTIVDSAFYECTSLESVVIPDSVAIIGCNAFNMCSALTTVTIPDSVISIGESAFYDCANLTSITIPDNVEKIGHGAFFYTGYYADESNWENDVIYINNHLIVAKYALSGNYTVKPGTKTIADFAFYNCDKLASVTISSDVRSIGESAFKDCNQLASVTVFSGLRNIGESAFKNCDNLASIVLPSSVRSIEQMAFEDCDKLNSISLPSGVESIGDEAFNDCDRLFSITLPDTIMSIGIDAFKGTLFFEDESNWENDMLYVNKHLVAAKWSVINQVGGKTVIKDGTKTIADNTFVYAVRVSTNEGFYTEPRNITPDVNYVPVILGRSFVIPKSVTNIGRSAFGDVQLNNVFYEGTKAQWNKINIKIGNSNLINSKIHYNCSDHTAGKWIVDQKATVTASGTKHQECNQCGLLLKNGAIPQLKCTTPKLKSVANVTNGIKFTWNKVAGADSYTVMRKAGSGKWVAIKNDLTSTTYTDTTAKNGTTYKYTVKAKNEAGFSGYNTTGLSVRRLANPIKITVANAKAGTTVKWGKVTGATGYYVMRKTGNGSWIKVATVKGTTYTDKTAKSGVNYKYTIKAYYGKSVSAYNTTGVAVKRLVAPKISSAVSNREGILLKWNNVTGASGYYVYRKATSGDWKKIATVKGNTKIKYLDEIPRKGVNYQYYVKAYSGESVSVNSNTYKIKCKY